jgi:MFS transporter, putative metabolite:H+ symporter
MFSAFVITWFLRDFGVNGVFVFISGAMVIVICAIGLLGPRTRDVALGSILR